MLASFLLAAASALAAATPPVDAEIASEKIDVSINSDRVTAFEIGTRSIHILTEAGLRYSTVVLPLRPFTEITSLVGVLVLPDGKEIKAEERDIVRRPYIDSSSIARDTGLVQVRFPRAVVGATVRVSWNRTISTLLYLDDWAFRRRIPIRHAVTTVSMPRGYPLRFEVWNGTIAPAVSEEDGQSRLTFEVRDAAALADEPFAPDDAQLLSLVRFAPPDAEVEGERMPIDSWEAIGRFYQRLAEGRDSLDPQLAERLRAEARAAGSTRATVERLYRKLQEFRYLQVYLGIGGYQPHAAMWTDKRRYGDCKDLATYFLAMLHAAGIEAQPMLTTIGGRERFREDFPSLRQFNHVVAWVPLKDGPIVVDATAPTFPLGAVPGHLAENPGLVMAASKKGRTTLLKLPGVSASQSRIEAEVTLEPVATGGFRGPLVAKLTGDMLARGRLLLRAARDRLEGREVGWALPHARPGSWVRDVKMGNGDEQLVIEGMLESPAAGATIPGHTLLSTALLIEDDRVRAFASDTRETPIDLGQKSETIVRLTFTGTGEASCPAPVSLEGPFGRYRMSCEAEAGAVHLTRDLAVERAWIEPADYAQAREFWMAVAAGDRSAAIAGELPGAASWASDRPAAPRGRAVSNGGGR